MIADHGTHDGGRVSEANIEQRLTRLERIVFDDQEGDNAE
jgi:hypothetical protein